MTDEVTIFSIHSAPGIFSATVGIPRYGGGGRGWSVENDPLFGMQIDYRWMLFLCGPHSLPLRLPN